jgi:amino acid permease
MFLLHFLKFLFVTVLHPMLNVFYYPNVFQLYFKILFKVMIIAVYLVFHITEILNNSLRKKKKTVQNFCLFVLHILLFFKIKLKQQNWNITVKQKTKNLIIGYIYIHKNKNDKLIESKDREKGLHYRKKKTNTFTSILLIFIFPLRKIQTNKT